jgi:hypothetical protein
MARVMAAEKAYAIQTAEAAQARVEQLLVSAAAPVDELNPVVGVIKISRGDPLTLAGVGAFLDERLDAWRSSFSDDLRVQLRIPLHLSTESGRT